MAPLRRRLSAPCHNWGKILEMSVLGRDILNLFALVMHRAANLVAMIGGAHTYTIQQR
jgi:hypothetical protein